jgi:hypothetical protein
LPAGGLEALELVEGAIKGALDAGFVAAEGGEGVGALPEHVGEAAAGGEVGVLLLDVCLAVGETEVEETGFEAAKAAEPPLGHDDLMDEGGFEGAGGLEVVEEGVAEFVEGIVVFVEDGGVFGGEAVLECVEANGGLAFGGDGAGAELGVTAIGGALFAGGHRDCSFEGIARV